MDDGNIENDEMTRGGSRILVDESFSFNLGLHPSDSGYGDSPSSINNSSLRFAYGDSTENAEETSSRSRSGVAFGLDDAMTDEDVEDDDDVFMDTMDEQMDVELNQSEEDNLFSRRRRQTSAGDSAPINIPLGIQLPGGGDEGDVAGAMATPPRHYPAHFSPSTASPLTMYGSPGRWSSMATRFNSPTDSLRSLWHQPIEAPVSAPPDRRQRFWSEGCELLAAAGSEGAGGQSSDEMVPPLQLRDRSRSEPAIQGEMHRLFGRELRRISDEFHRSYETLHESRERVDGERNGNGLYASSYPDSGSRRHGQGSPWWQRIIHLMSPRVLAPVPPSPNVSPSHDDDTSPASSQSSQNSTETVRIMQRQASEVDADVLVDEVDAQVPQMEESDPGFHAVEFQVGESDLDAEQHR